MHEGVQLQRFTYLPMISPNVHIDDMVTLTYFVMFTKLRLFTRL